MTGGAKTSNLTGRLPLRCSIACCTPRVHVGRAHGTPTKLASMVEIAGKPHRRVGQAEQRDCGGYGRDLCPRRPRALSGIEPVSRSVPHFRSVTSGSAYVVSLCASAGCRPVRGDDMVPSERTFAVAVGHGKKFARHIDAWLRGGVYTPAPENEIASADKLNSWYYGEAPKSLRPVLKLARAYLDLRRRRSTRAMRCTPRECPCGAIR